MSPISLKVAYFVALVKASRMILLATPWAQVSTTYGRSQISTTYVDLFLIPGRNPCKWTGKSSVTDLPQSCLFCSPFEGESNDAISDALGSSFHNLRQVKAWVGTWNIFQFCPISKRHRSSAQVHGSTRPDERNPKMYHPRL